MDFWTIALGASALAGAMIVIAQFAKTKSSSENMLELYNGLLRDSRASIRTTVPRGGTGGGGAAASR